MVIKTYVASCIECGERFISYFNSDKTDKNLLYKIGRDTAAGWGAECISVSEAEEFHPEAIFENNCN